VKKIQRRILAVIALFAVLAVGVIIYINSGDAGEEKNIILSYSDFSEKIFLAQTSLDDEEKHNINEILQGKYIVGEEHAGFSKYSEIYNVYDVRNLARFYLFVNDDESIELLKEKTDKSFNNVNLDDMQMLDLLYYFETMNIFEYNIEKEMFFNALDKFFDSDSGLFFLFSSDDMISNKITITGIVCEIFSEEESFVNTYLADVQSGLQKVFEEYRFKSPDAQNTFFNSGGDIIFALNASGVKVNGAELEQWYLDWKNSFGEKIINIEHAAGFAGFIQVSESLGYTVSDDALRNYLSEFDDNGEINDLSLILSVMEQVDITGYSNFYVYIKKVADNILDKLAPVTHNIDIAETYYGYILSELSGFEIDEDALKKTVRQYYDIIDSTYAEENCSMLSHYLYYTVMLDQILSDGRVSIESGKIADKIEEILKNAEQMSDIRKALEVGCALNLYDDAAIEKKYIEEIKNAIEQIEKENKNLDAGIIDIYLIKGLLGMELTSDDTSDYFQLRNNLFLDGAYRAYNDSDVLSISTTFDFIRVSDLFTDYENIDENKEYIEDLMKKRGIYVDSTDGGAYSLKSIYYGNIINDIILGGKEHVES